MQGRSMRPFLSTKRCCHAVMPGLVTCEGADMYKLGGMSTSLPRTGLSPVRTGLSIRLRTSENR
jgi:hypothetical protein